MKGFGALSGIAIVVVCLTVSQISYLAPDWGRKKPLFNEQTDKEPRNRSDSNVARNQDRHQKAPSWFV
jgi:hypothetical protein